MHRHSARVSPPPSGRGRGGGDAGSLLPGVLQPELVACLCGHTDRDMSVAHRSEPPPPPSPSLPPPSFCGQYTHKHCTSSAVQSIHKRGTHRTRLAQELHNIFVRLKRICHLVRTCLTLCCSRTCVVPRAHLLPHSLFLLPRH